MHCDNKCTISSHQIYSAFYKRTKNRRCAFRYNDKDLHMRGSKKVLKRGGKVALAPFICWDDQISAAAVWILIARLLRARVYYMLNLMRCPSNGLMLRVRQAQLWEKIYRKGWINFSGIWGFLNVSKTNRKKLNTLYFKICPSSKKFSLYRSPLLPYITIKNKFELYHQYLIVGINCRNVFVCKQILKIIVQNYDQTFLKIHY